MNQDGLTFLVPQARTLSYMKSYLPSTIKLWNNLSLHIRNFPTLSSFSQSIKKLFIGLSRNSLIMVIVKLILFTVN